MRGRPAPRYVTYGSRRRSPAAYSLFADRIKLRRRELNFGLRTGVSARFKNLLDVSEMLRSDRATSWENIVQSAEWIVPPKVNDGRVDWLKAWEDLSARLPAHIRKRLAFRDYRIDLSGLMVVVSIAAAERATSKPLNALRTPGEIKIALDSLPGSCAPDLLFSLWRKGRLKQEHLRVTLLDVWRYLDHAAAWPMRTWRAMFRCAGFLSDDGRPRPARPLLIYRGCTRKGRRGMSWTTERGVAEKFADCWFEQGKATVRGDVYKARVKPRDVLAMIRGKTKLMPKLEVIDGHLIKSDVLEEALVKPEFEVITDARYVSIVLVETAKQRVARKAREERKCQRRYEAATKLGR